MTAHLISGFFQGQSVRNRTPCADSIVARGHYSGLKHEHSRYVTILLFCIRTSVESSICLESISLCWLWIEKFVIVFTTSVIIRLIANRFN
jgi:hypothetical protein